MGNIYGTLGISETRREREDHDFYCTDPVAAEWLIKIEDLSLNIWECACGEGHLSKVFETAWYNVKSTDLIDRGYGVGCVDSLKETETFHGDIVTNPPYKYAQEFIEHALSLVEDGSKVCMFLKVQFLEGKRRRFLYNNYPPKRIWVSSSRISCGKSNSKNGSMIAYAWFVWEKGYKGETVVKWFN